MFRAAHRSSSGALNCICSLWFTYTCGDRPLSSLSWKWPVPTQTWQDLLRNSPRKLQRATPAVHNRAAASVAAGGGIFENQL